MLVMNPTFFADALAFRTWLAKHAAGSTELLVGFHKVGSGRPCMSWSESVDEALCFGWIDGVRRRIDDESYTNRFTPRRRGSNWSLVNIRRALELIEAGLMQPAGLAAFEARDKATAGEYSYESRPPGLDAAYEAELRAAAAAWAYWETQPPHYRQGAAHWVMSAKREETQRKRLATLIEDSAAGRRIALYRR